MKAWQAWVIIGLLAANLGLSAGMAVKPVAQWWFRAMAQALGEKEATIIIQRAIIQRLQQALDQAQQKQGPPNR